MVLFLLSCTNLKPLKERLPSKSKRELFLKKNNISYNNLVEKDLLSDEPKIFIQPKDTLEMPDGKIELINPWGNYDRKMIKFMYGKPNKAVGDSLWYYIDHLDRMLLRVEFDKLGNVRKVEQKITY